MHIDDFKSIVSTFADPGTEILFEKTKALFSINGECIDVNISSKSGDIFVEEFGKTTSASLWIVNRLANLRLLASRLTEQIPIQEYFVSPHADFLPSLAVNPQDDSSRTDDAKASLLKSLAERTPLETTVLYVTSDAGEGKTSLINSASREQAKKFSQGESDWLLVPIILGGRHFLRFDDITVGALQNKYRFPFLYYESFLALVRMGVIVPAFDGFEEMFVENSSGEALSAMGILVGALRSTGAVVVAARKAYFEFENLKSQEKLYDTISQFSVGFSKLEILRWEKSQFIDYCRKRRVENSEKIYDSVCERLGSDHSLLTRPVLVRRLIDIAEKSDSLGSFVEKIQVSGSDFFSVFVLGIIEREANEKWLDRSGEIGSALLTTQEHCELLSMIAINMWESGVDYLKRDHLEVVTEFFCESKKKTPFQAKQILERVRGHALLVASADVQLAIEFDHDEFRQYFLGDGLASLMGSPSTTKFELHSILRRGVLPDTAQLTFTRAVARKLSVDRVPIIKTLLEISKLDGQASYTQENCGSLTIRLLCGLEPSGLTIDRLSFGVDCLRDRKLKGIEFKNCYFSQGSLEATSLDSCTFIGCSFGQIRLHKSTVLKDVGFNECDIESVRNETSNLEYWEPAAIKKILASLGCYFDAESNSIQDHSVEGMDDELLGVEKLLRYFMRSTHISESVIKIKLSDRSNNFIDQTLTKLIELGVVMEIENQGRGHQRRFKLAIPLSKLNEYLAEAHGSYEKFLKACEKI
jgi:hypothetical protein